MSVLSSTEKVSTLQANKEDAGKIASLCAQHETVRFTAFSAEVAWEIGTTIRSTFTEKYGTKAGVVVHIETLSGHTLFSCAVGNPASVGPDNWLWVRGKINVVKRYGVSSLRKGREIAAKGFTPEEKNLHFPEYAPHGGAFPVFIKNVESGPIAAIVVSGLPQLEDHQLIVDSLAKLPQLFA